MLIDVMIRIFARLHALCLFEREEEEKMWKNIRTASPRLFLVSLSPAGEIIFFFLNESHEKNFFYLHFELKNFFS